MTDWQDALRERLLGNAGVSAVCRDVNWTQRVQGQVGPQIVLHLTSDDRVQTLKGFTERRGTRVQFDALGNTRAAARDLREIAIAAVAGPQLVGTIQFGAASEISTRGAGSQDGQQFTYREIFDAVIWHN